MMKRQTSNKSNGPTRCGFTLLELVVVLAIIAAMVAVTAPFCKRSNDNLKIRQAGNDLAQSLRYAIDLAVKTRRAVKFVFDDNNKGYCLQMENGENNFEPVSDFTGTKRFIDRNIHLFDIENFDRTDGVYSHVFDPKQLWQDAWVSFSTNDSIITITIKAKSVEIEEKSM